MSEKTAKRTKRIICAFFAIVLLLTIVAVSLVIAYNNRLVSSTITVSGIQGATQTQENYILAKVGDNYYELDPSTEFSKLFQFEEWDTIENIPSKEPAISLQFAELWVVDIYENGTVAAYDGYAPSKYKASASYVMPISAIETIIAYLEKTATPHSLGDGTISTSTFKHG